MSKIIFVDVDGPMIPVRAYFLPRQTKPATIFDPLAVAMLNRLIVDSDAKLVISSTIRSKGRDFVVALLFKNGIDPSHLHYDWCTKGKFTSQRMHEIKWWYEDHIPEVTHYVALEDEDLDVDFVPNAVKADTNEGFSFRNYLEARVFLDIHTPADIATIEYLKRRELWRLKRLGEQSEGRTAEIADELFPGEK